MKVCIHRRCHSYRPTFQRCGKRGGRIRAVEVARGRTGYGFTLSGQSPCVLSCILKGSPADYVGLRSGDYILSVNDINVSKASHEDVVKLIGRCSGVLKLVIAEGERHSVNNNNNSRSGCGARGGWYKPKMDSKQLGINRAEKVVAELQSGGIFNMIFENSSHSSSSSDKERPVVKQDVDVGDGGDLGLEPGEGILNVGMIVGYLGSIELASTGTSLENDSLQAIRGSMRRLRAEQKIHSLVLMKVRLNVHLGVARRFGFECTPDPDTGGCLEFPPSSQPLLQFVSVLYRDMGDNIEGVRARAFHDPDNDAQQNHSTSSNSDSGIGNFLPEEKSNRVLLVDLGGPPNHNHISGPRLWDSPPSSQQAWSPTLGAAASHPPPPPPGAGGAVGVEPQRWLPVHVLRDWRQQHHHSHLQGLSSDQESYAESTDGWSSANCSTLPPPMNKIPADRYRAPLKDEWAKKLFGAGDRERTGAERSEREKKRGNAKDGEKKRTSARRSFGRSKRLSLARSLDDLEVGGCLQGCSSDNSLNSNASLPSVQSHRRHTERRVASWAVCFERLLQDPVGVRYFSEFLKKEFSEENILFWQACEFFSHVPENDKKQLSQRAREIYNSFLSSKATTPVNIDSQAQLADDILNAPRPDMFREQQLQIFNLMKFDSYTRFLKSLLYQECMLAEVEGRPLPDPYHIPSSPTSKHSTTGSDRSNLSTPKKEDKKSKSGRSLNEDSRDDSGDRRKGMFFSWSRNRSFGKGPKKRELADFNYSHNGRRESQGSLSSGASLELGTSGAPLRQCNISLPDGSCCSVPLRAGVSIRDLLLGLCEKLCINLAAIDLFLVGGEKPLVLDQDCMTLCSRDLRLEKRTLFRLDLVPINRSVGLKAKPTKPVTEVLRPVVAKYGLHLSELVARISGESEPLDLGLPISNLDGLRVVLDIAERSPSVVITCAHTCTTMTHQGSNAPLRSPCGTQGEDRPSGKAGSAHPHGENGKAGHSPDTRGQALPNHSVSLHKAPEKRKQKKINIDEAEEFFDLISKAQSNRADDQRGLLNKSDLQLPDFLRLSPVATNQAVPPPYDPEPSCSTPHSRNPNNGSFPSSGRRGNKANSNDRGGGGGNHLLNVSHQSQSLDSALGTESGGGRKARPPPPFPGTISPIHPSQGAQRGLLQDSGRGESVQMLEEDTLSDLTLVGEGDINSPSLNYVTPSALPCKPPPRPQQQAQDGRPSSGTSPV
uniref:Regulator of G protein signaling 12b n=1 Tax=Seriola lalandi dorsalis TaxID=1841481 RepID=A0A3B4WC99_SERLL